jgi:hypothetical protein
MTSDRRSDKQEVEVDMTSKNRSNVEEFIPGVPTGRLSDGELEWQVRHNPTFVPTRRQRQRLAALQAAREAEANPRQKQGAGALQPSEPAQASNTGVTTEDIPQQVAEELSQALAEATDASQGEQAALQTLDATLGATIDIPAGGECALDLRDTEVNN